MDKKSIDNAMLSDLVCGLAYNTSAMKNCGPVYTLYKVQEMSQTDWRINKVIHVRYVKILKSGVRQLQ